MHDLLRESILRQYRATHDGDPWYGTSRVRLLRGVSAATAMRRPIDGGHTIWELVLHMIAWTEEVHRRLVGGTPAMPARGDWPDVTAATESAWRSARTALTRAHNQLATAIAEMPARTFALRVGEFREPGLGTGVTVAEMLIGLAQHDAYHIAQIALVRQAIAGH